MRQITLVGFGNQGRAWAHNLRDSGWLVRISGRPDGKGMEKAAQEGFAVVKPSELKALEGPVALLLPDESIPKFFDLYLRGANNFQFIFAHGFSVVFGNLPVSNTNDLILVAPKGIGQKLRENYVAGSGVMGVLGVKQDASGHAWDSAEQIAKGLGLDRVGLIRSTFEEETKADLLSEQVILCGAVPKLVAKTVTFLVEKGINPKLAEYECLNELKLIVDMMVEHSPDGMMKRVSSAARFGGITAADVILPEQELDDRIAGLWAKIESGEFATSLQKYLEQHERT